MLVIRKATYQLQKEFRGQEILTIHSLRSGHHLMPRRFEAIGFRACRVQDYETLKLLSEAGARGANVFCPTSAS